MTVAQHIKTLDAFKYSIGRIDFLKWKVAKVYAMRVVVDEYDVVQVWHFTFIDGSKIVMRVYMYG